MQGFFLFDTGSQRSYIIAQCREKLPTVRAEPIVIKTFGSKTSQVKDIDVAVRVHSPGKVINPLSAKPLSEKSLFCLFKF